MKKYSLFILFMLGVLLTGCQMKKSISVTVVAPGGDLAVQDLLQEITRRQSMPYALPENNTFNYIWAQYMLSFLAAERCGYLDREEAVARIRGMLDTIIPLERYYGFSYDGYDLATGKKTTDKIYFQGWWLFTLPIIKEAYPELGDLCQQLMDEIDYIKGGMYDPETAILATDHWPESGKVIWVDFYSVSSGEIRSPAVAYTYHTGDISPWIKKQEPAFSTLYGQKVLHVYQHFFFCTMLMHTVFPDFGYFDRSWDELLIGLEAYRIENGMTFYPTRAEPLEALFDPASTNWPNTEHRISKPWQAWQINPDAPVMEEAFIPGSGIALYYDNMNFYWSYGGPVTPCEYVIGTDRSADCVNGTLYLPFHVFAATENLSAPNQVELTSFTVTLSCDNKPRPPLTVYLDEQLVGQIYPEELNQSPTEITLSFTNLTLTGGQHSIQLSTDDSEQGYHLYRRPKKLWEAWYEYETVSGEATREKVVPPAAEIVLNGQHRGGENPFALLTRCSEIHGYFPWQELLNDPQFLSNTVVWVGDYFAHARIGQVVHNTSSKAVTVHYERPEDWTLDEQIRVVDITTDKAEPVDIRIEPTMLYWEAKPWHTYRVFLEKNSGFRSQNSD